jgi:hypothetical protein
MLQPQVPAIPMGPTSTVYDHQGPVLLVRAWYVSRADTGLRHSARLIMADGQDTAPRPVTIARLSAVLCLLLVVPFTAKHASCRGLHPIRYRSCIPISRALTSRLHCMRVQYLEIYSSLRYRPSNKQVLVQGSCVARTNGMVM